ncbi:MAG: hypothetical protein ABIT71_05815, partial [Vicinamibacteraceae bacterium]
MRKNLTPDADPSGRPAPVDAATPDASGPGTEPGEMAASDALPAGDNTAPSLVWPPVEDELNDWEVLHLQSTGQTIIEPTKPTPPAAPAANAADHLRSFSAPPTPAPYVPPAPIDDPAGETSLLPISNDFDLPETELIEPLTILPTMPMPAVAAAPAPAPVQAPAPAPDDRTVVIPRPAAFRIRPELPSPVPPASVALSSPEDTNPGTATRILVAPNFAATVGHAPTVPVSALHRAARPLPAFGPRPPMEDTLPAGLTRERLADGSDAADHSDDTSVPSFDKGDTHPVPSPVGRRTPAGPPSPFSRVPSRGLPPVAGTESAPDPAPISLAPPPLAFGPRVPPPAPAVPPFSPPAEAAYAPPAP